MALTRGASSHKSSQGSSNHKGCYSQSIGRRRGKASQESLQALHWPLYGEGILDLGTAHGMFSNGAFFIWCLKES